MAITQTVGSHDFVRTAKTSVGLDGVLTVTMDQRRPVVRIMTDNGYDFYYTADGYIVPAGRHSAITYRSLRALWPAFCERLSADS